MNKHPSFRQNNMTRKSNSSFMSACVAHIRVLGGQKLLLVVLDEQN
jgi:hypothetical protein